MLLKTLVIIISFYLLVLFQTSFLIHFDIFLGKIVNYGLILIPIILISLLTPQKHFYDFIAAFSAGFFLDLFSGRPIGISILILVLIVFFIGLLKKHINLPNFLWINILKIKK